MSQENIYEMAKKDKIDKHEFTKDSSIIINDID